MSTKVNKPKSTKPKQAKSKARANKINNAPLAVSYAKAFKSKKPRMVPTSSGGLRVAHTEYVFDINGTASGNFFLNVADPVQPGYANMFPWLSRIAALYDSYVVNSIMFHYEPLCATTTSGGIFMSMDPDASDPIPIDKAGMMSYSYSAHGPAWKPVGFSVTAHSLDALSAKHYVRTGSVATAVLPTYDVAWFYLAIQNTSSTAILGELYVTYDITLFDAGLNRNAMSLMDNSYVNLSGTFNRANYLFGVSPNIIGQLPLAVGPGAGNFTNVYFESSGQFWCVLSVETTGTAPTAVAPNLVTQNNLTVITTTSLAGVRFSLPCINTTSKAYIFGFYLQASGTSGILSIDPTTFLSDNTANLSSLVISLSPLW